MSDLDRVRALMDARHDVEVAILEMKRKLVRLVALLDETGQTDDTQVRAPFDALPSHNLTTRPE